MAFDAKQMERDILEAVNTHGIIVEGNKELPAVRVLTDKYSSREEGQRLTAVLRYLVEERYLFPLTPERIDSTMGITPKGFLRLQAIQHPIPTWLGANWFPAVVAFITAGIGIASVVSNWARP